MTSLALLVLVGTLALAYANGANDNFKGVATLYGSGVMNYRAALLWATATTFLGSLAAAMIAQKLIVTFTGKGLIPDALIGEPTVVLAVLLGAGLTVFIAALLGIPLSTTHALTGALLGTGLAAVGSGISFPTLGKNFFLPLAVSPLIPVVLIGIAYPATMRVMGLLGPAGARRPPFRSLSAAFVGDVAACHTAKNKAIAAVRHETPTREALLNAAHMLSGGAVSFARGLNDTPKIVAIAATVMVADIHLSAFFIGVAMAVGGVLHAEKVACTMACRITPMSNGQGALANLVTSAVVIGASLLGMPVSTTHVSCGALFGLGAATGKLQWRMAGGILSAWVLTLPIAAALAASAYLFLTSAG